MNIYLFGIECAAILFGIVIWAWWAYENDKVAPGIILLVTMCITAFIVSCLVFVCVLTFGG